MQNDNHSTLSPASMTSSTTIDIARRNSRLASRVAILSAFLSLTTIAISLYIDVSYGKVAAVPVGDIWDLPIVGRLYVPSRIEENAKPIHVALRYIRNFYEIDLTDFVRLGSDVQSTGGVTMVSSRATQLLPYVIPGSKEYTNVLNNIDYSSINYRLFNESKCWRRFLVDSVEMTDSLSGTKRIDVMGKFIIACDDTTKPIPSQNLGNKLITIYVIKGVPTMFSGNPGTGQGLNSNEMMDSDKTTKDTALESSGITSAKIAALNPEGWFVVKNTVTPLSKEEISVLLASRLKQGAKPSK